MSKESTSESCPNRSSWLYWLVIAGLFLWVLSWLWWYEPEHDEVEHWHVAWLMHQGQQPFQDFFEHHSPLLWNLLRTYYVLVGENYGIILASRALMVIVFALTIWLIYRIARRWVSPGAAWIAALGFPTFSLGLLLAHLFVRSDPLILLLLVVALWLACPLADGKNWGKRDTHRLFWIFVCLGLALGFSPRAGIPVATLFLMLAIFSLKKIPLSNFLIYFVIGGMIVVIPTLIQAVIYHPELYFYWVYYFSATLYPSFSPLKNLVKLGLAAFPIWILVAVGIFSLLKNTELRTQRSLWLVVAMAIANFFGLWASTRPYMQHFLMTIPFFGFLAGFGYDYFTKCSHQRLKLPAWNFAGLILLIGLITLYGKSYRLWSGSGLESRPAWTERARWLMTHCKDNATFAGGVAYFQPLFLSDAFYHWSGGRYATLTMRHLQPDFAPYTLDDLKNASPDVIHESVAEAWGFARSPQFRSWLVENYDPTPFPAYWLKKTPKDP